MALKERDCPKCSFTPLVPTPAGGISVDECPKCGGRWYDLGELSKTVKDPKGFTEAVAKGPLKPKPSVAICPSCHKNMVNAGLVHELLRVDLCPVCRGLWLDKGELGLIDRLLKT